MPTLPSALAASGSASAPRPVVVVDAAEEAAWRLFNQGDDFVGALAAFRSVLDRVPDSIGALQGAAASLRQQRAYADAKALLDSALVRFPSETGLLAELAWWWLDQKRYAEAIDAFAAVLRTGRGDEGVHLWQIGLLRNEGRFVDARRLLDDARRAFPNSSRLDFESAWLAFREKEFEAALEQFETLVRLLPAQPSAWQGRIASLRMLERHAEADDAVTLAFRHCGRALDVLMESGWLAFVRGRVDDAVADFGEAAAIAPRDPQIKVCLAQAHLRYGDEAGFDQATRACRQALAIDPLLADAHGVLGIVAFQRGKSAEAERHLRRSTEVDPRYGLFADLGSVYARTGRPEEARKSFAQAIANDPTDTYAHVQMGRLLLQEGEGRLALHKLRHAVALDEADADARHALAACLLELGQPAEAELELRAALRRLDASRCAPLRLALCELLTRQGDDAANASLYEEALAEADAALALTPSSAEPHFFRGVVRYKLGDLRGALAAFQACVERDAGHVQADLQRHRLRARLASEHKLIRSTALASALLSATLVAHLGAELAVPQAKESMVIAPRTEIGFGPAGARSIS